MNLQPDAYVVAQNVTVTSTSQVAMFGEQGGAEIFVYGSLFGRHGAIDLLKGDNRVTVASSGVLHSDAYGVAIGDAATALNNRLENKGSIYGGFSGVFIAGSDWSVHNSGLIQGGNESGIRSFGRGTIVNDGVIQAPFQDGRYQVAIYSGSGGSIINNGLIKGDVKFNGSENLYDGRLGAISGKIIGSVFNDTLLGGAGNETFYSGIGNNIIDGGDGIDTLEYSLQSDDYARVDLRIIGSQVTGARSTDTISNIENLVGSAESDFFVGNDTSNVLSSGAGDDTLDGWFGDDTLNGGDGIDTALFSSSIGARVDLTKQGEGQNTGYGFDTLISIENLEGGSGADWFRGDGGDNVLTGNDGNDTLIGGEGNDTLDGGAGSNTAVFSGTSAQSQITNNGDGTFTVTGPDGTDLVRDVRLLQFSDKTVALWNAAPTSLGLSTTVVAEDALTGIVASLSATDADGDALTYTLASTDGPFRLDGNNLILTGALDFETRASHSLTVVAKDAYGGQTSRSFTIQVADVVETTPFILTGTGGDDRLEGEAGNDVLTGLGGNDVLLGEAGNDRLSGGAGRDVLTGGSGQDVFVFDTKLSKSASANRANQDTITDFNVNDDTIYLAKSVFTKLSKKEVLKAGEFYVGTKAHDQDDRIIYDKKKGALYYDADGTGSQAQIQIATLTKDLKMTYKDFFVI
ncbi:hypothetical protein AB4072_14800 [Microvirga sp. 2MCAF38]|uniref:hypothetical protein n=1 Tax=Microvirga sp. 2MCAF38 TaxID=3232989 RepID=UPI003F9A5979